MAGESARDKARRLRKAAEHYERGADGEDATAEALAGLPGDAWRVIHDVAWPGRKLANIDHVVVGPSGVFVIDSKNWSGEITVEGDVLRQNRRARRSTVQGAEAAAEAVAALLPGVRRDHVHAVLCFTGREAPSVPVGRVLVCSTSTLVRLLGAGATVLTDERVRSVAGELRSSLPSATAPRPRTVPRPPAVARARPARSKKGSGKRRSPRTLVSAGAGLVMAVVLVTNPAPFIAVSNGLTDLITDQVSPKDQPADRQEKPKKAPGPKKAKRDRTAS